MKSIRMPVSSSHMSKNINNSFVLVQSRKTLLFITERLLMGRKESNQTLKGICLNLLANLDQSLLLLI